MKKTMIALAAAVLFVPTLATPSAEARRIRTPAGEGLGLLGLFAAQPRATEKSTSNSAAYLEAVRKQRAAKAAKAVQAAKEAQAARAAESSQVAASAQVVKTLPVATQVTADSNAAPPKVAHAAATSSFASSGTSLSPIPGQAPASLDCRKFIPSAAMTISVACND
jgi:hypothetical protein